MTLFIIGLALFIGGLISLVIDANRLKYDWVAPISIMVFVIGIILMVAGAIQEEKETMHACEDIGGEYVAIKREYSVSLKQVVDVYGCVK